jgi:hypothetical protein
MSQFVTVTIRCSGPNCSETKKDTNHWQKVWEQEGKLVFAPWREGDEMSAGIRPLCGDRCSHNVLGTWLERLKRIS